MTSVDNLTVVEKGVDRIVVVVVVVVGIAAVAVAVGVGVVDRRSNQVQERRSSSRYYHPR